MPKRKKPDPNMFSPTGFTQLGMPFVEAMFETDVPSFVFQPVKVLALGQFQAASLINKRCLACLELPQKLAACRTPIDFMNVQQRFLETAMRDYADAFGTMAEAWGNSLSEQTALDDKPKSKHDYLPLPGTEPEGQDIEEHDEFAPSAGQNGAHPISEGARRNAARRRKASRPSA